MDQDRSVEVGLRFELCEQPIDVVDVFGPLDLRHHDDIELVACLRHQRREVIESPRRIEAVDPSPQLSVAHLERAGDADEAGPSGLLVGHGNRIFEIAEKYVDRGDDVRQLGDDLVDVRREEVNDATGPERNLPQRRRSTNGEGFEEVSGATHERKGMCRRVRGRNGHDGQVTARFKAILFDAGGVLVLPDPTVLGPLLAYYGGDPAIEASRRAHYAGMAAKSAAGSGEVFWDEYNHSYVRSIGVPDREVEAAAVALHSTRNAFLWRWPIPESMAALHNLSEAGIPLGVVSNASGQIAEVLSRSGVCQAGDGPYTPMRVVIDSHVVGVAKPDPRIFDFALPFFDGIERHDIAYVGDSVTMDIGAAAAAGLHPILLDPYDDHTDADFERIQSLTELTVSEVAA